MEYNALEVTPSVELTDEELRWHLRGRWDAIHAFESEERRRETEESRWRRFRAINNLAGELRLDLTTPEADKAALWARWQRLREAYEH